MPGAETKGRGRAATYVNAKLGYKKGGRIKAQFGYNSGRTNLLDESRRIRSEPQTRNVRAEEARVGGELSAGFKKGGRAALKHGTSKSWTERDKKLAETAHETAKRGDKLKNTFMWKGHRIIDTPNNRKKFKEKE